MLLFGGVRCGEHEEAGMNLFPHSTFHPLNQGSNQGLGTKCRVRGEILLRRHEDEWGKKYISIVNFCPLCFYVIEFTRQLTIKK